MMATSEFNFKLRKEIEVFGCDQPVNEITLHEIGEGYDSEYFKLRKYVMSALVNAAEMREKLASFEKDEAGEVLKKLHEIEEENHMKDSKDMAEMISMVLGQDDGLENLTKTFSEMVGKKTGKSICTVNGTRVKEEAWKRVHPEDKAKVSALYCCFFGIGLDLQQKKDSEESQESPMGLRAL